MPRSLISNRTSNKEQQNLFLQSETFSSASWTKSGCTITSGAATDPLGGSNASAIVETGATSRKVTLQSTSSIAAGTLITCSCYMKKASRNFGTLVKVGVGGALSTVFFDLNSGILGSYTVDNILLHSVPTITAIGSGWYLCSATFYNSGSFVGIGAANINGTSSYTGTLATQAVYIWGANLNMGTAIPPYKSTTTTTFNNGNVRPKKINRAAASNRTIIT